MYRDAIRDYILDTYFSADSRNGVDDETDLIALGVMDSLAIINTLSHLEGSYDLDLGDAVTEENFTSIASLARMVESHLDAPHRVAPSQNQHD